MQYTVGWIRSQGIECKWSRSRNGAPIIIGKTSSLDRTGQPIWSVIDTDMWNRAKVVGLPQAFEEHTTFIGLFSVPA